MHLLGFPGLDGSKGQKGDPGFRGDRGDTPNCPQLDIPNEIRGLPGKNFFQYFFKNTFITIKYFY
jgi:hypothetical protein